jgi:hypothetical protein
MREFSPGKRRDAPVDNRVGGRQAQLEAAGYFALPRRSGKLLLAFDGISRFRAVVVVERGARKGGTSRGCVRNGGVAGRVGIHS